MRHVANIAVIDVETTGLNPFRSDRIVEVAAVVVDLEGNTTREFVTLVNPGRDIGPTHIHGLRSEDILFAPKFGDIAGAFLEALDGCVAFAGHNIRFDRSFLDTEFNRLRNTFPEGPSICTMRLAGGGSLSSNCQCYGISLEGQKHSALYDARATARLLTTLLEDSPRQKIDLLQLHPIKWPSVFKSSAKLVTRDGANMLQATTPSYIERLLALVQPELPADIEESAVADYVALLDRVLEDRTINAEEGISLVDLAKRWGISAAVIKQAHDQYLLRLITAALDGGISETENKDLALVARLLAIDSESFKRLMKQASEIHTASVKRPREPMDSSKGNVYSGKNLCFTGECQGRLRGELITREMAEEIASRHGITVHQSVTKKLDVLVVADPLTQSGKANKARQYGIRVVHEPVFWKALGLNVE